MDKERFTGCMTALVTPFNDEGVDHEALAGLVRFQIEAGINGLVPCGSTGEAATMSTQERRDAIRTVVKTADGRVPVIAGTGSNNTAEAIVNSKNAQEDGVDAVMLVAPYYNKPPQGGLVHHFAAIANEVDIPVILYNVPGRTGVSIAPETVLELSKIDNIIAVKEASGMIENTVAILQGEPDLHVLSGDDPLYLPLLAVGARGLISVVSNIMPEKMVAIYDAWTDGRVDEARQLFYDMWPVMGAMFYETNPIPVKAALGLMGKIDPRLRLPLIKMNEVNLARLRAVVRWAGVIE